MTVELMALATGSNRGLGRRRRGGPWGPLHAGGRGMALVLLHAPVHVQVHAQMFFGGQHEAHGVYILWSDFCGE